MPVKTYFGVYVGFLVGLRSFHVCLLMVLVIGLCSLPLRHSLAFSTEHRMEDGSRSSVNVLQGIAPSLPAGGAWV